MISQTAIDDITESAEIIVFDPLNFGRVFYEKLFAAYPSVRAMFRNDIDKQADKLSQTLLTLLSGLEDLDRVLPDIIEMGQRHLEYGAQPAHFDAVGAVLIDTLAELAPNWSPEMALAWSELYTVVADVMMDAAAQQKRAG